MCEMLRHLFDGDSPYVPVMIFKYSTVQYSSVRLI